MAFRTRDLELWSGGDEDLRNILGRADGRGTA